MRFLALSTLASRRLIGRTFRRSASSSASIRRTRCFLSSFASVVFLDAPGLVRSGHALPQGDRPGRRHVAVGRVEKLRVVVHEMLSDAVRDPVAVFDEFLSGAGFAAHLDDVVVGFRDRSEAFRIGAQRRGQRLGVAPVVLGAGGREAVAEAVELHGIDGVDQKARFHQGFDHGSVRRLDGDPDQVRRALVAVEEPVAHGGEPHAAMGERPLLDDLAPVIHQADVMFSASPVHAGGVRRRHVVLPGGLALAGRLTAMPFGTCTGAHGAYSPLDVHRGAGSQGTNPSWVLDAQCAVGAPGCPPTSRYTGHRRGRARPRRGPRKLPVQRKTASRFPPDLGKPADRFPTATAASAAAADRYKTVTGINPGKVQVRRRPRRHEARCREAASPNPHSLRVAKPLRPLIHVVLVQHQMVGAAVVTSSERDLRVDDAVEVLRLGFREHLEPRLPGELDEQAVAPAASP